jgi:hypothetical protein
MDCVEGCWDIEEPKSKIVCSTKSVFPKESVSASTWYDGLASEPAKEDNPGHPDGDEH